MIESAISSRNILKAHFIGIAGAGMSAVAKLLRDSGVMVTGSDEGVYPPISDFLAREGIAYATGYAAKNIPADCDLIVIGKNARLVPESNAEVRAAFESGKPIRSFPEVLAELSADKNSIVVAGSYGKSTCASLLAHILQSAGANPSYFIGAIPLTPDASAHRGQGTVFVLEGDEYPSSNTDPRAKFLHYRPDCLLLAPLAHDHVNVYPTIADYLLPFRELVAKARQVVACLDGPLSRDFIGSLGKPVIAYGLKQGDYHAAEIAWGEVTRFTLMQGMSAVLQLETSQLGEHSVQNIVGAAALLLSEKLVAPQAFAKAVASFKGVRRRLDRLSDKTSVPMFEGFGSSYEKARSAIAAVKRHFPERNLVVVFEPHAFSWRNREALGWYDDAFVGAGRVFVYEPAQQGAATHAQLTQAEIVVRIAASGLTADALPPSGGAPLIAEAVGENDVILFLSSGAMGGLIADVPPLIEEKYPADASNPPVARRSGLH